MLFTHFGVSGPLVLSASSYLADSPNGALLEIDLKPGLTAEQLDLRILRDFEKYKHKQVQNAMCDLLPQRLIDAVLHVAGVDAEITVDNLTREQRGAIVRTLKCLPLTVRAARPVEEAIITRGGVLIKEINPSTMESRIVPGLYFAGKSSMLMPVRADSIFGSHGQPAVRRAERRRKLFKHIQRKTLL